MVVVVGVVEVTSSFTEVTGERAIASYEREWDIRPADRVGLDLESLAAANGESQIKEIWVGT